jgi:hypothetical protein
MTIMVRVRNMRFHVRFPLHFLMEVVDNVVNTINRGPSSSLYGCILDEEWVFFFYRSK